MRIGWWDWAKKGRPLPPIAPLPSQVLSVEVERLTSDQILHEQGPYVVLVAKPPQIPALLLEVGRLREATFREVGEGTGAAVDLDAFDEHYDQLILWNRERREVVGAYRLTPADQALRRHGPPGLYTASLFQLNAAFFDELGPAIELGRSFIRPEYQRRPQTLLLLWRGIGRYLERYPAHGSLFGPVSISSQYSSAARAAMVEYFERCSEAESLRRLVKPRRRFRGGGAPSGCPRLLTIDELDEYVRRNDAEPDRRGIPVLLRHYLNLGGRVLALSVDPWFGNCLDALVVVNLRQPGTKLRDRVLAKRTASYPPTCTVSAASTHDAAGQAAARYTL